MPGLVEGARPRWRTLRFLAGVFAGFLAVPALSLIGVGMLAGAVIAWDTVIGLAERRAGRSDTGPPPARLSIAGADVSKAGGVRIAGQQRDDGLEMSCRGRCDDLTSRLPAPARLSVVAEDGRVLAQRDEVWKTRFFAVFPVMPWAVGGEPVGIRDVRPGA